MTRIFGIHPGIIAFLIALGAALMLYGAFLLAVPDTAEEVTLNNHDLRTAGQWAMTVAGALLYLAGGILYGRSRGISGLLSFLLHLLPIVGLVLMTFLRHRLTPYENWQRDNPGLDSDKTARRTYRNIKPLY